MPLSDAGARFADAHRVARLATADDHGVPHVVPVCYARADDRFYFVIDDKPKRGDSRRLKRLRNIAVNPRVALVIDEWDEDWRRLAYLLIHGDAAIVDDEGEYAGALARLRDRYPQYRTMPLRFVSHPMVRIRTRRLHFWRADRSLEGPPRPEL